MGKINVMFQTTNQISKLITNNFARSFCLFVFPQGYMDEWPFISAYLCCCVPAWWRVVYLSVCLSIYLSIYIYISIYLSIYLSIFLSFYLIYLIYLSIYLSTYLHIYLYLSIHPSIYLSIGLSIYLQYLSIDRSINPSMNLSVYLILCYPILLYSKSILFYSILVLSIPF